MNIDVSPHSPERRHALFAVQRAQVDPCPQLRRVANRGRLRVGIHRKDATENRMPFESGFSVLVHNSAN